MKREVRVEELQKLYTCHDMAKADCGGCHGCSACCQGMGNTVLPMVSGIAEFVMRTGGVLVLPALMGENGIFIAEVSAWLGADLILVPSYFIMIKRVSE